MALPVIKAKSYNYGSYANPQQVKFRAGVGTQIGEQFGAGVAQGMQEKRAEKKEQEKLDKLQEIQKNKDRLAAENKFIEKNASSYYEVYGKENVYSFGEFMKDNITYDDDSVDMKFQKKVNRENLLNVGTLINKLDNDGIDYTDKTMIANLSSVDLQNIYDKNMIKNGALIVRTDKSTNPPSMKYFIPEISSKGKFATTEYKEREVDIMSIFNHKLTPKYNDNVLADEKYMLANEDSLKKLPLEYVKQEKKMSDDNINGRIYEVIDADKLFEDPDINFTPGINAIIDDYGESIWVDTENKNFVGPYTGSDDQKEKIREKLREDLKSKISGFRLSSTKYTVPENDEEEQTINDKDIVILANKVNDYFNFPLHEYGGTIKELEGEKFAGGLDGPGLVVRTVISDKPHPKTGKIGLTIEYKDKEYDDFEFSENDKMVISGDKQKGDPLTKFRTYPLTIDGKQDLLRDTNYLNIPAFRGSSDAAKSLQTRLEAELIK